MTVMGSFLLEHSNNTFPLTESHSVLQVLEPIVQDPGMYAKLAEVMAEKNSGLPDGQLVLPTPWGTMFKAMKEKCREQNFMDSAVMLFDSDKAFQPPFESSSRLPFTKMTCHHNLLPAQKADEVA